MNYAHLSIRVILVTLVISLLPFAVFAHDKQYTAETVDVSDIRGAAQVPLRASELASFVLSTVALVTAGIALSRTGRRPHSTHHVS